MNTEFELLPASLSIADATGRESSENGVHLVGDEGALVGIVTKQQLHEAMSAGHGDQALRQWAVAPAAHAHPDHPIAVLVERLAHSSGLLPIVSRADAQVVLGVVTVERIMHGLRGVDRNAAALRSPQ